MHSIQKNFSAYLKKRPHLTDLFTFMLTDGRAPLMPIELSMITVGTLGKEVPAKGTQVLT